MGVLVLVIYDITEDKIRTAISNILKDYGCIRVQKSAFLGDLTSNQRDMLIMELIEALQDDSGNIQIYPLCRTCFSWRKIIGEVKEEGKHEKTVFI